MQALKVQFFPNDEINAYTKNELTVEQGERDIWPRRQKLCQSLALSLYKVTIRVTTDCFSDNGLGNVRKCPTMSSRCGIKQADEEAGPA